MVVTCEQVWQEISNYLEGDVNPELRAALEEHMKGCKRCTAVLDGTRNVISVYSDDRVLDIPFGYHQRLRRKLQAAMPRPRGTMYGWALAFAALALITGSIAIVGSAASRNHLRDQLAEQGSNIPASMKVIVVEGGKTFHVAGCTFIHQTPTDKERIVTAAEAMREGYTPCVRCMREYLRRASIDSKSVADVITAAGE
jgi:Putative zinc-finger